MFPLRPPRGLHRAHLHQAYKPCFIRAVPPQTYSNVCWWSLYVHTGYTWGVSHRFVMSLLKWYKVKSLQRWISWTPRGGLKLMQTWRLYWQIVGEPHTKSPSLSVCCHILEATLEVAYNKIHSPNGSTIQLGIPIWVCIQLGIST